MRKFIKYLILSVLVLGVLSPASAHINPKLEGKKVHNTNSASLRMDCSQGESVTEQSINNVRATLLLSGDVWWNPGSGAARYVVPKVDQASGLPEVSSIFSGAVWLGGIDGGDNLKVACQQYGSRNGNVDFWPGPLTPLGVTGPDTCASWDRHFLVLGEEIDVHLANFQNAQILEIDYDTDLIPDNVKYYPGRGNRFFADKFGFELPDNIQGLGSFFDVDGDMFYEPEEGDFPMIEIRDCPDDNPQYADEMIFWIYNDAGNVHGETNGAAIGMEVQVQAFGYKTNDELNNMTFQRYKLINRAISTIDSTYFAMWVDPDLGCSADDYIGCDTTRSLMYIYNSDELDGQTGCGCDNAVETYCDEIPMLGVDYFRGPLGPKLYDIINGDTFLVNPPRGSLQSDTIVDLGMSSFTYYFNGGNQPPPGTDDPGTTQEFYNYLSGTWKDGLPFTTGGDGHNPGSTDFTNFAFPDAPDASTGWNMVIAGINPTLDPRTVQASGPFRLDPGSVNELIIGVPWVPNIPHPAPSLTKLLEADDLAQQLFDNCFDIPDGPDAPDVDWIELDQTLVALLSNDTLLALSNNACEKYTEVDIRNPGTSDSAYVFEGYRIYQMASPESSGESFDDAEHFRLVVQVDLENDVHDLYNWSSIDNPSGPVIGGPPVLFIAEKVLDNAPNDGIRHMFKITEDAFGGSDKRLINHKKYYFVAIAYGFNNYKQFNPETGEGQKTTYLVGRRNIGDGVNSYYTVIPRPIVDRVLNSDACDEPAITRTDGVGAGENNLRITTGTRDSIMDRTFTGRIQYLPGSGPISVDIYNPLDLVEADFELTFIDENMANAELDDTVRWVLREIENDNVVKTFTAKNTISTLNEQLLNEYGFAISIVQSDEPGDKLDPTNGGIGVDIVYADPTATNWLSGQPDDQIPFHYVKTLASEDDNAFDPSRGLSAMGNGTWVPYTLCDYRNPQANQFPLVTPAWFNNSSNLVRSGSALEDLPNVDVVFTSDPSLWSECIVVEKANSLYTDCGAAGLCLSTEGDAKDMDLRKGTSVNKDGSANSSNGTGMGWFPGYAINVETGERLNIFFGENSVYSCDEPRIDSIVCQPGGFLSGDGIPVGRDMIFNPTDEQFVAGGDFFSMINLYAGGQHMVYVTDLPYDGCDTLRTLLNSPAPIDKVKALRSIRWTSFALAAQGTSMLPAKDGLIPNDVTVHLRVDNKYSVFEGTGDQNGYPTYEFSTRGLGASPLNEDNGDFDTALDQITVVPNPYYGFSEYETSAFSNIVKVTNLPAKATVTIYSLEGKFIRQYKRDEQGVSNEAENNRAIEQAQYLPNLEWDLKNNAGIPVAAGVYLIHIDAGELGERVVKWFGVARRFDASGL